VFAGGAGFPVSAASAQEQRAISIVGLDYTFQAPDTTSAGPVLLSFLNQGTVHHEVVLYVANQGVSLGDYLRAKNALERRRLGRTIGLLAAEPGQASPAQLMAHLQTGRTYVLLCNLQNATDHPAHSRLGMGKLLIVR
jgi:hypothetical protein